MKFCTEQTCEIAALITNNIYIFAIYRSPYSDIETFCKTLNDIFNFLKILDKDIVLLGDPENSTIYRLLTNFGIISYTT